ncbi:MAG TPA: hypothetical protein VHS28_04490 [Chloroflexota bacterium]|nr:hypothetical protein [Chloroflexota bacterium]
MKGIVAFVVAVALMAVGVWLSIGLGTPQIWLFGAGLIGLIGISAESFLDQPSTGETRDHYQAFTLWIAPGLLAVSGVWLVQMIPPANQLWMAVAAAVAMALLLVSLKASLSPSDRFHRQARFAANLILYLIVFVLFALIYHTKERSLFTATSIGVVSLLAALEVLRLSQGTPGSGWQLGLLVALVVSETTWALNYWPVSGLVGGAMLLLTFYVFAGLVLAIQEGGIERRMVAEYCSVGAAGLLVVAWAMMS